MNKKYTCMKENPLGEIDTMCEISLSSDAVLRIYDVIKVKGSYVMCGWVWSDTDKFTSVTAGQFIKKIELRKGWNKVKLAFDASNRCSVNIGLTSGTYRIYHLVVNAGDIVCDYDNASLTKYIVFGLYDQNMEASIYNESDDEIGFICRMQFDATVVDPKIYMIETGEYIEIKGSYNKGEVIEIDSHTGRKSIKGIYHNKTRNLINKMTASSSWLSLRPGINHVGQTANEGREHICTNIIYTNEYEGV